MPDYEYVCVRCGVFQARCPMAESVAPRSCPDCGRPSERALASPHLRGSRAVIRYRAEARNEKSANEPSIEHRLKGTTAHHHAYRGHEAREHVAAAHSDRPWMVGH